MRNRAPPVSLAVRLFLFKFGSFEKHFGAFLAARQLLAKFSPFWAILAPSRQQGRFGPTYIFVWRHLQVFLAAMLFLVTCFGPFCSLPGGKAVFSQI